MAKADLLLFCGPMFSGKTETLLRLAEDAATSGRRVTVLKPSIDFRNPGEVVSHAGTRHRAVEVSSASEISAAVIGADVVAADEVQFFDDAAIETLCHLARLGTPVIAAGLDFDYRAIPFRAIETLKMAASQVQTLKGVCSSCGKEATLTQRLVQGLPADPNGPTVLVGGAETYQPRCADCYLRERQVASESKS
jgi:thymidine kinase